MMWPPRELERGPILAIVSGIAAVLLGLAAYAVDASLAQQARAQVQAAADAGALAATYNLLPPVDETAARQTAATWVGRNGYPITESNVQLWNHPSGQPAVTVRWKQTVPTGLARLIGIRETTYEVASSAALGGVTRVPRGYLPIALPALKSADGSWTVQATPAADDFQPLAVHPETGGTPLVIAVGRQPDGSVGNGVPLALDGHDPDRLQAFVIAGSPQPLAFGSQVSVFNRNAANAVRNGLATRLEAGLDGAEMILPLVEPSAGKVGASSVTVIGLLAARITGQGESGEILATFHEKVLPDEGAIGVASGTGAYAPVLVETPRQ